MPTLFLCGDVMTGRGIDQILPAPCDPALREPYITDARDYVALAEEANGPVPRGAPPAYPWGDLITTLDALRPDARIVNLETSITTHDAFWPGKGIHYRMSPANATCLSAARLDACVLANNHVLDFDRPGLDETLTTLARLGIHSVGTGRTIADARRPVRVPCGAGRHVVLVGTGHESSGVPAAWHAGEATPGVDVLPDLSDATADELAARARAFARPGDPVVVSIHWGDNWGYEVPVEHVRFAHRLVEGGVDIVHGHSSHHPRPLEVHRGRLVLYGCGDFLNDYEGIRGHESFRGDLVLGYLVTLADDRSMQELRMLPFRIRRFRLEHATRDEATWLARTLSEASAAFGTLVEAQADGLRLAL